MSYRNVYVAKIAMGASERQVIQAFDEAESYDGPSLIIAYSHCIAHGYNLNFGLQQQKLAVDSGHWPLYRHDPRRIDFGEPALQLDSKAGKTPLKDYVDNEVRYRILAQVNPKRAKALIDMAEAQDGEQRRHYENLARVDKAKPDTGAPI